MDGATQSPARDCIRGTPITSHSADIPIDPERSQPKPAARLRLFFAAWPPARAAEALHRWALETVQDPTERVLPVESLHLTLAFLGDTPAARVPAAVDAAHAVAIEPQMLRLDCAGHWLRSQVVWAGPSEAQAPLESLAADLRARLTAAGFALEDRAFSPHVTLVRRAREPRAQPLPTIQFPLTGFVLVHSTTTGSGSRYDVVERFSATTLDPWQS